MGFLTREDPVLCAAGMMGKSVEVCYWVGERGSEEGGRTVPPTPEIMRLAVEEMWEQGIELVIIDCVGYLVEKIGYPRLLKLAWTLKETAVLKEKTVVLVVSPSFFSSPERVGLLNDLSFLPLPHQEYPLGEDSLSLVIMSKNHINNHTTHGENADERKGGVYDGR